MVESSPISFSLLPIKLDSHNKKTKKIAILVVNLGGPPNLDAVPQFLFNLFYDRYIIDLPNPCRYFLALLISITRAKKARRAYQAIGGGSPILKNTLAQASAIESELTSRGFVNTKVFTAMRYYNPYIKEVAEHIADCKPDKAIILPLYPQFSTVTTLSAMVEWKKYTNTLDTVNIGSYPTLPGFINAYSKLISGLYSKLVINMKAKIIFSAHGIPMKIIKSGDPYQKEILKSVAAIVKRVGLDASSYVTAYQSKVGPLEWLGPSTESEVVRFSKAGYGIIVVPISFVSEHLETLEELDQEYRKLALSHGNKNYFRVPTVSLHADFIEGLADLCTDAILR